MGHAQSLEIIKKSHLNFAREKIHLTLMIENRANAYFLSCLQPKNVVEKTTHFLRVPLGGEEKA